MLLSERADLEQQLQAADRRALETEKRLKEAEQKILLLEERADSAEHRALLSEERADRAEQATQVVQKRLDLAEESIVELERKLYEAENDLEDFLVRDTERMGLGSSSTQQGSTSSLKIISSTCNSCNSLCNFYVAHDGQQSLCEERRSQCGAEANGGDQLSITSL